MVFGSIVACAGPLPFPGRRIVDAMVDLPSRCQPVAGIALTSLYAPKGWLYNSAAALGIKVAHAPLGIVIALIFIGLPSWCAPCSR